ncbi:MAG: hypothetical protein NTX79_07155 [Candidatus Micrarchaeota archaeon]|nr:hypothetical protein [Candidatus Micrarchaeota archaeon]
MQKNAEYGIIRSELVKKTPERNLFVMRLLKDGKLNNDVPKETIRDNPWVLPFILLNRKDTKQAVALERVFNKIPNTQLNVTSLGQALEVAYVDGTRMHNRLLKKTQKPSYNLVPKDFADLINLQKGLIPFLREKLFALAMVGYAPLYSSVKDHMKDRLGE